MRDLETHQPISPTASQRRKEDRRLWRNALLASLVIHALVFLFWRTAPIMTSPFAAAGPRANDAAAARGSMQALNMATPAAVPLRPPPVPLPTLTDIEPIEFEEDVTFEPAAAGTLGAPEPPGIETGTGQGDGGTAEEGLYRMIPPSPRGMIIPPTNRSLRGTRVEVWVFVDERGRVVPDSTRLRPPTSDRKFNERLIEEAAEWIFEPARQGGEAIATWFPYTISM